MPSKLFAKFTLAVAAMLVVVSVSADPVPAGTRDEIRALLAPFGKLCRVGQSCGGIVDVGRVVEVDADADADVDVDVVADTDVGTGGTATAGSGKSGAEVYNQFCFACHNTGVTEAPIFADAESWAPRIEKGMDALLANTLNGIGLMPPRGTCMACSDEELEATVEYMLSEVQ